MTRGTYRVRSLDDVLAGVESVETVEIDVSARLDVAPGDDLFWGSSANTLDAQQGFGSLTSRVHGAPIGTAVFHDVALIGRGLIVEPATRTIWTGQTLGWSDVSIAEDVGVWFGAEWQPGAEVEIPDGVLDPVTELDEAVLLAQPGFSVYGHWLVDVAPRIIAWKRDHPELPAVTGGLAPWSRRMAIRLGMPLSGAPSVVAHRPARIGRLVVPTLTKREHAIDRPRTRHSWDVLRAALLEKRPAQELPAGKRIYVSRSGWHKGRSLVNDQRVERRMRRHGYTVLRPEKLNLRRQAWIFAESQHVVGVDGSGLHNLAMSPQGARLTVLDTYRTNLFHAGVANVRRQHLTHLAAEPAPDESWRMPVARLDEHLEELRRAAS